MKKSDGLIIGLIAIGIIGGYFYDIQIARALFNPNDAVGLFVQDYGNLIPYGIGLFSLLGLSLNESNVFKKSFLQTLAILLTLFISIYLHSSLSFQLLDTVSFSFLFLMVLWILVKRVKRLKTKTFAKWFKFILISFILILIIPNGIKFFVLRFRPYMFMGGCLDYSFYLKWLPFNTSEDFRSFPSFHAAMSGIMMVFVAFPMQSDRFRKIAIVRSIVFISFIAFYRMVIGAHFLSDVSVSILIDFIIMRIVYYNIVK